MRLFLALVMIFTSFPSVAIEISNFKSGLACTKTELTKDSGGWICQQTHDIFVTDQGSCVYNGVTKPCTWIGFEFDYKLAEKATKLQCISETSEPTAPGNPNGVIAKNVKSQPYELELSGESGHFFNPMYYIFSLRLPSNSVLVDTYTCKADGKVLFQAKFNLHFPEPAK